MKRAIAALGLTAIVAGVPIVLVSVLGRPRLPSFEGSEGLSGSYVPAEVVLGILGLLAWALWAYLAFAVVVNILAELATGWRMPGGQALGATSRLLTPRIVRSLVELAVGGAFVAASVAGHVEIGSRVQEYATAATVDRLSPASNVSAPATEAPKEATYRVRPGDSLWRIAERELGSGFRWRAIYRLNRDGRFADGRGLTNPHLIRPGWVLELPEKEEKKTGRSSERQATEGEVAEGAPSIRTDNGLEVPASHPTPVRSAESPEPRIQVDPGLSEAEEPEVERTRSPVLNLPSGLTVAASFVSGLLTANMLARLRRRRSRRLSAPPRLEPPESPLALGLRRAGASPGADLLDVAVSAVARVWSGVRKRWPPIVAAVEGERGVEVFVRGSDGPLPPDTGGTVSPLVRFSRLGELTRAEVGGPFPTALRNTATFLEHGLLMPLGSAPDGRAAHLAALAGPVGITGTRADDLVRQMIVTAASRGSPEDLEVVLLGVPAGLRHLSGLPQVTGSFGWEQATVPLRELQAEFVRRARLFLSEGLEDIWGHLAEHPDDRLPGILVVIGEPPSVLRGLVGGLAQEAQRCGASFLAIGWRPTGARALSDAESERDLRTDLPGAESLRPLFLPREEAEEAMGIIGQGYPRAEEEEEPGEQAGESDGTFEGSSAVVEQPIRPIRVATEPVEDPGEAEPRGEDEPDAAPDTGADGPPSLATLRCLGPLQLFIEGRPLRKGWRAKSLELISYLVANREGVSKERIVEELWPETDPERGSDIFYAVTSNIRQKLRIGDDPRRFLDRQSGVFRLLDGEWWVDAWEFEHRVRDADVLDDAGAMEQLREAVGLYRGEFCAETYYPWAEAMREHLRSLFVQASARLADVLRIEGGDEEALGILNRAIEADPVCEDLVRRAMLVEASLGRRAAALDRYRRLETTLDTELSVEPDPETQAIARQLVRRKGRATA